MIKRKKKSVVTFLSFLFPFSFPFLFFFSPFFNF